MLNTNYYILHTGKHGIAVLNQLWDRPVKVDERISILSISTYRVKPILYKQLELNNIPYKNTTTPEVFKQNANKIDLFAELLKNATTEYCLLADAIDSCIVKDLDQTFIDKFESLNVPFVFSNDRCLFPWVYMQGEQYRGYGICAGLIFGRTAELLQYFTKLAIFKEEMSTKYEIAARYTKSDQFWIRLYDLFREEKVAIDINRLLLATGRATRLVDERIEESDTNMKVDVHIATKLDKILIPKDGNI